MQFIHFGRVALALGFASTGIAMLAEPASAQIFESTILQPTSPVAYYTSSGATIDSEIQGGYGAETSGGTLQALTWSGASVATNITPAGYYSAQVLAVSGNLKGGIGATSSTSGQSAIYWNAANQATNLNPSGFSQSFIQGMTSTQEVGYGLDANDNLQAILWNGTGPGQTITPTSVGFNSSAGLGMSGNVEVGYGVGVPTGGSVNAIYWTNGVFSSAQDPTTQQYLGDLAPAGSFDSRAYGVSGPLVVGSVSFNGSTNHAVVWNIGTADPYQTYTDITPTTGISSAEARGVMGNDVVGFAAGSATAGNDHAELWIMNGTSFTNYDLNNYLPNDPVGTQYTMSEATGIASNGTIIGTADYTVGDVTFTNAVEWKVVPAPDALPVLAGGFTLLGSWLAIAVGVADVSRAISS